MTAPLRLYEWPTSGNCWKVRLALRLLGLPFERVALDRTRAEDRARVATFSRHRRLPVLELTDGSRIVESAAILVHLCRGTALMPADGPAFADCLAWLFYEQADLCRPLALPRFFRRFGLADERAAESAALQAEGARQLAFLEGWLAERAFLTGDRLTAADIACHVYVLLAPEGGQSLEPFPALRGWLDRIRATPGWEPLLTPA